MALKPWYKVVTPREDLREGKPLDASEFAVHLDKVRTGTAPLDYRDPERFFSRTYLTDNLTSLAAEVLRRLSGEITETSPVFNMTTQFGGGKTHALTLLYHLAKQGSAAQAWHGIPQILSKAGVKSIPDDCTVAVFVGTEFDSVTGRGGTDGTPLRKTPWGELAFQLGGAEAFNAVEAHDREFVEPKGDVIQAFIPKNRPCLILLDEIINYVSSYRDRGYHNKFYNFIQSLSETVRGLNNAVLVVSIPASEISYTDKDEADQQRFKNLLDRLGKAVIMSVGSETSEIIRRRLFEWDSNAVTASGKVMLSKDALETCGEFAGWVKEHRQQLPNLINPDYAREQFAATYPFHPMVLSVFERKWQTLPRFQQTRGILRLLALWVSKAYQEGFKGAHRDALITLGTAPLDDPVFRAAVFEQLGETKLEAAITTDIVGKKDAHSVRLDAEAVDTIKKARLHQKVASTIFFESNGGQAKAEATIPEIRLSVADPDIDLGNVETAIEALTDACYYLEVKKNHYRFGLKENLNKKFADRKANVPTSDIEERVKVEIQKVFLPKENTERVFFPEKSIQISDRPVITFVVGDLQRTMDNESGTIAWIDNMTRESGTSARTFKSALIWCIAESAQPMKDEARKLLAWEDIEEEAPNRNYDESDIRQLKENVKKAQRDLKESVWRAYKKLVLLGKDNIIRIVDLGLVHSSAADSPITFIVNRLIQDGDIEKGISPNYLVRNWPPAFTEWSTKSVRDAFYASPLFPKLLNGDEIKDTIARGVNSGIIAYIGKKNGDYEPFVHAQGLDRTDVEISNDMYIITKETAEAYKRSKEIPKDKKTQDYASIKKPDEAEKVPEKVQEEPTDDFPKKKGITRIEWTGDVPPQKWMNFYTKVLSRFAADSKITINLNVQIGKNEGISSRKIEETKSALKELGLDDKIEER